MMKKIWIITGILATFATGADASICKDRLFTLSTKDSSVSAGEIVKQLAAECAYSVLLRDDEARVRLQSKMPIVNIRQAPLRRVFDVILKENGLHYEFDNSILRISYLVTKTFKINYVGTDRSGVSNTEVSISRDDGMGTQSSEGASGGASNGSSSSTGRSGINITAEDGFRFWEGIQAEILSILNRPGDRYMLSGESASSRTSNTRTPRGAINRTQESSSQENHQIHSVTSQAGAVVVNRGAGLVTVTGTSHQIERVEEYINALHERLQSQVMIDVSILTVRHHTGHTTGVDWNQLYNLQNIAILPKNGSQGGSSSASNSSSAKIAPGEVQFGNESGVLALGDGSKTKVAYALNVFSQGVSLTRVVEFLKKYGDVSSVSNPKVLTLNNQPAMISVGNIIRYRKNTVFQTSGNSATNTSVDTEYPSVFAGVLLDITPSVYGGEIMLKINPSITQTKGVDVELASTALETPPNLSTNQLSSLVRVQDGQKIVLGGLISKSNSKRESKIPLLGDIPLLGYFFSHSAEIENVDEMVIVITPHIIKKNQGPSLQDLGYDIIDGNPKTSALEEEH